MSTNLLLKPSNEEISMYISEFNSLNPNNKQQIINWITKNFEWDDLREILQFLQCDEIIVKDHWYYKNNFELDFYFRFYNTQTCSSFASHLLIYLQKPPVKHSCIIA